MNGEGKINMNKSILETLAAIEKGVTYARDELAKQPRNLEVYEVLRADADALSVLIESAKNVKQLNKLNVTVG